MAYYILHKDRKLIGVTPFQWESLPGVSITRVENPVPDLNHVTWNEDCCALIPISSNLSKLDFMSRFTAQERIAIQVSTDPIIKDAFSLVQMAEFVNVDDMRTQMLVGYLAMTGVITNDRVVEVLA